MEILKGETATVKSLVFCVVLHRSLFVIVVSVLPFTGFDYPFGVFKLFFKRDRQHNDQMKKGHEDENGRQNNQQKLKT